ILFNPKKPCTAVKHGIHMAIMGSQNKVVNSAKTLCSATHCSLKKLTKVLLIITTLFTSTAYADVIRTALNESGVMVLTNSEVQTGDLSLSSLRAIFTIRKRSWDDKTPIKVYVLPDGNPLHQKFCKSILKVYPYVLREQWDRLIFSGTGIPPTIVNNERELQELVNATPGAIGYAPITSVNETASNAPLAKLFVLRTNSEY
ncbi:hypothetical protein, partial [Zhongshania sp.]|uniref:hypothetical protein n=1 Tax=Zhongshania sp. TaxID=1971902 RepID=UPI0035684ABC